MLLLGLISPWAITRLTGVLPPLPETAPSLVPPKRHVHARVGPYSKYGAVALIDGRSREAQFMRAYERMLVEHVGGQPSPVERALISRAARLALYLELLDAKALGGGEGLTDHDQRAYMSWHNGLRRTLESIGLKAAASTPQVLKLSDYLAKASP